MNLPLSRGRALRLATLLGFAGVAACAGPARAVPTTVFATDFESGLPAEMTAPGSAIEGVQGYAGLGQPGNQFGGSFLRYTLQGIVDTKLTLRNLPPHDAVDVGFLLAIIDSWDGTELMQVAVDGNLLFSHWFQLALGDASSYVAPPGALLSSGSNLGFTFGSYYVHDRAYDLSVDPAFIAIPHTADTLEVTWFLGAISGGAAAQWQGGGDESWAIDNLRIAIHPPATGVAPGAEAGLSLAPPWPNPGPASEVRARFTLASGAPARLDLYDARGRRLAGREVGSLGPGAHAVTLVAAGPRAPGVAFLRLVQGLSARTTRVVLLD